MRREGKKSNKPKEKELFIFICINISPKANAIQGQGCCTHWGQYLLISADSKAKKIKPLQFQWGFHRLLGAFY